MSKVKVKTLIGSVVTVAFFLTVIVAFLFYAFPENVASPPASDRMTVNGYSHSAPYWLPRCFYSAG
jgi:hypothetical protein